MIDAFATKPDWGSLPRCSLDVAMPAHQAAKLVGSTPAGQYGTKREAEYHMSVCMPKSTVAGATVYFFAQGGLAPEYANAR